MAYRILIEVYKVREQGLNDKEKRNSPIFNPAHIVGHTLFMQVLNIGLIRFSLSLVPLFFTPLLPSNTICHQLSHRECFFISYINLANLPACMKHLAAISCRQEDD